jgi:hypothetical protein
MKVLLLHGKVALSPWCYTHVYRFPRHMEGIKFHRKEKEFYNA